MKEDTHMFKSLIAKRNRTIVKLFELGLSKSFIAQTYDMTIAQVSFVIRRGAQGGVWGL